MSHDFQAIKRAALRALRWKDVDGELAEAIAKAIAAAIEEYDDQEHRGLA